MYDVTTLQTAFESLVGIRQPNIPGVPTLSAPLTISLSGIYADDKNALVTTENIYYSSPNFDPTVYPVWGSGNTYLTGSKVSNLGILYIALSDLVNDLTSPPNDPTNWDVYNPFQIWMQQIYNQAVSNFFSSVFTKKKLLRMAKVILERQQLYRGSGSIHNKIIPEGRFVGFEILPQQAEGLWVYIDEVGFQGNAANPNMKFYLYHSDQAAAIASWVIPIASAKTFQWSDLKSGSTLNCIMKYLKFNTSGVYYFGYYEEDIVGNALSKDWNCSSYPCVGCDGVDISYYNQWSRYTTFRNIQVPSSALESDRTLFDTSRISYGSLTNWGMNLSITVRCNLTDYIIYNKLLFADAFATQIAKELLEKIAKGIRIGPSPAQTKVSAISDLDEKSPGNWIKKMGGYEDTINALNIDMSGFSKSCLPCDESKKIKFFSM